MAQFTKYLGLDNQYHKYPSNNLFKTTATSEVAGAVIAASKSNDDDVEVKIGSNDKMYVNVGVKSIAGKVGNLTLADIGAAVARTTVKDLEETDEAITIANNTDYLFGELSELIVHFPSEGADFSKSEITFESGSSTATTVKVFSDKVNVIKSASVLKTGSVIAVGSVVNGTEYEEETTLEADLTLTEDSELEATSVIESGSVIKAESVVEGVAYTEDTTTTEDIAISSVAYVPTLTVATSKVYKLKAEWYVDKWFVSLSALN